MTVEHGPAGGINCQQLHVLGPFGGGPVDAITVMVRLLDQLAGL